MNTCQSFLEAMKFKGLPFHFALRLKYKGKKKGARERGREGGRLRQQNVSKTQRRRGTREREDGEEVSSKPLLLILTLQIDWFKLPVNQHLHVSRLLI